MTKGFHTVLFLFVLTLFTATAFSQTAAEAPRYTGEPISINMKDVDVRDFLRLIHEISGLNIVVDPAVHGAVTLVLDDVPWDQALALVLKNNGLVTEREGKVLRVMTVETAKREHEARAELAKAESVAGALQTVFRRLSYAKASEAAPILRHFLSPRGQISVDERTNTLIITDVPEVVARLRSP